MPGSSRIQGIRGATPPWERPGFKRLLERVEAEPRPVLVNELSRLAMSFYGTLKAFQELEAKGAPVIAVSPRENPPEPEPPGMEADL